MSDHSLKKEQDAEAKYKPVHEVLQANLLDQLLLNLQVKQAHWNIVGPRFITRPYSSKSTKVPSVSVNFARSRMETPS